MSGAVTRPKGTSESVRISNEVKKRLQEYCRQHKQPIRRVLDKAICDYVQNRNLKEER